MQMGADDRRRVRVPKVCRWCEAVGTVALEVRIVGGSVALRFLCRTCAQRWTATATEILWPDHRFGSNVVEAHGCLGEDVRTAEGHRNPPN
jgi:hypothetical protein